MIDSQGARAVTGKPEALPVYPYRGFHPRIGAGVFLAPSAAVIGDVEVGDETSFWFHTVARGDVNSIQVGERTSIQDGAILHVTHRLHPLRIGSEVVVGHGAILHGCTVEEGALIGIGARVLDGAVVESGAQIGAGALLAPGERVVAGHLAVGVPARVVRPLSEEERRNIRRICKRYVEVKESYRQALGPGLET